jgi:hypothetical protein
VKLQSTTTASPPRRPSKEIPGYAWADDAENKKVKIYITKPESIVDLRAEQISLKMSKSKQRIKLTISDMDGHDWFLRLNLSHEIVECKFKKKPNKIIVFLTKRNSFKWYELTTKTNNEVSSDDDAEEEAEEGDEDQRNGYGPVDSGRTGFGVDDEIPAAVSMPACPKLGNDSTTASTARQTQIHNSVKKSEDTAQVCGTSIDMAALD